ncbi:MAG: hypothetical protein K2Q11_01110 [Burkholderiaceae bacterium]|nr:hypothetical protein [Burkholderiaceae bacterium]
MEECIAAERVIFPTNQRIETWNSIDEIYAAIESGNVPGSGKTLMIRREIPNLDFWIGKPIGFGRPRFKRYKSDLQNATRPLSSWIIPNSEKNLYDAPESLISGSNQEGARDILANFGTKVFHYPKPLSLIQGLLAQATRPGDTVLDFFAGSGTTGQAVLALNAQDGGGRRFILCSSTEATAKEPGKNLCRDVCAERLRRVITTHGYDASFAYLQLDKIEAADTAFEATPEHAHLLISMRETATAPAHIASEAIQIIATSGDWLTVLCWHMTPHIVEELAALPAAYGASRLAVFCPRPKGLPALLQVHGIEANAYSINDALLKGQTSKSKGNAA